MLSRIPARIPGEIQVRPDTEPNRLEAVGAVEGLDGGRGEEPTRRRVDSVQISRRGEERRLRPEPERPDRAVGERDAVRTDGGEQRPGPPRAPAPVNDLERRAAALEAYREVAAVAGERRGVAARADGAPSGRIAAARAEAAQGERIDAARSDAAQGERVAAARADAAQGERVAAARADAAEEQRVAAARAEVEQRQRADRADEADAGRREAARDAAAEPARLADPTYG